jgi:hypothetical protein
MACPARAGKMLAQPPQMLYAIPMRPLFFLTALAAAPALAADPPPAPPAVVKSLLDCRAITDTAQRLACLDAGVAALAGAVERRDVLVADRAAVKQARRGLFGLTVPGAGLLDAGKAGEVSADEKSDERGALAEITATITAARAGRDGRWRFALDDGSRWLQTDGEAFRHDPRAGMAMRIRRAAMGSFLANVDGQSAIRVKRVVD